MAPTSHPGSLPPELAAELAKLERRFRSELPHRFAHICQCWQQLQTAYSLGALTDLHGSVHGLVGSAATLRVSAVETAARGLEQLLRPLLGVDAGISPAAATSIDTALGELAMVVAQAAPGEREWGLPAAEAGGAVTLD